MLYILIITIVLALLHIIFKPGNKNRLNFNLEKQIQDNNPKENGKRDDTRETFDNNQEDQQDIQNERIFTTSTNENTDHIGVLNVFDSEIRTNPDLSEISRNINIKYDSLRAEEKERLRKYCKHRLISKFSNKNIYYKLINFMCQKEKKLYKKYKKMDFDTILKLLEEFEKRDTPTLLDFSTSPNQSQDAEFPKSFENKENLEFEDFTSSTIIHEIKRRIREDFHGLVDKNISKILFIKINESNRIYSCWEYDVLNVLPFTFFKKKRDVMIKLRDLCKKAKPEEMDTSISLDNLSTVIMPCVLGTDYFELTSDFKNRLRYLTGIILEEMDLEYINYEVYGDFLNSKFYKKIDSGN